MLRGVLGATAPRGWGHTGRGFCRSWWRWEGFIGTSEVQMDSNFLVLSLIPEAGHGTGSHPARSAPRGSSPGDATV